MELAQFRMGVSRINTHKYRHSNKLPEEVNCPVCENTPESEIHFLLHCPIYRNLRTRYSVKKKKEKKTNKKHTTPGTCLTKKHGLLAT